MKEIQRYEQPTREALEVASRGRIIKSMGQDQTANLAVYGNYLALDAGAAGYSLATLSARDAHLLRGKPPMTAGDYWARTTISELLGTIGALIYTMPSIEPKGAFPVTELLSGMGVVATGGVGAAVARSVRIRRYRRSATEACQAANQNFIPNKPMTFPDIAPETLVPYNNEREVTYGELWSSVSALQAGVNNPHSEAEIPPRQLHTTNMMRGMLLNFWSDEGRNDFLSTAFDPWTQLKHNLGRLRVYDGSVEATDGVKHAHAQQVIRTAGNVATIVAGFLDTRGMELHSSANQQQTRADTEQALGADREIVEQLTAQGTISRGRTDILLSVDAAYRHG